MSDILAEFEALIKDMSAEEKRELDKVLATELNKPWTPYPGPQTEAYFSDADLILYGGAVGGGKTDLLLGLAVCEHERSVIFRRAYVDLRGVEDRLLTVLGTRDGYNGADKVLRRGNQVLEFGALEKPGAEFSWQGRPHDFIGFDEGAQLSAGKVAFVLGWLRSTTGHRCRAVIASNPPMGGEGDWTIEWFAPWLDPLHPNPAKDGELRWAVTVGDETIWVDGPEQVKINGETYTPLSRTFMRALLDDNPALRDSGYRAQLQNMPEPVRSQLLHGDFLAGRVDHAYQVIPTDWVLAAHERWEQRKNNHGRMDTLGVDVAQGGADNTTLAPLHGTWFAPIESHKGVDTKDGPAVASLVMKILRDGALPCIDLTGGWGISARDHLKGNDVKTLSIVSSSAPTEGTKSGDYEYFNMRTQLWWTMREALDPSSNNPDEMPALPPDRKLQAELTAPRWTLRGQKILVEAKDEIRLRLSGASTDKADAVIQAWHGKPIIAAMRLSKTRRKVGFRPSDPLQDYRIGNERPSNPHYGVGSDPLSRFR